MNAASQIVPHWYAYPPKSSFGEVSGLNYADQAIKNISACNIYVHIPFCGMKCNFCSLYATTGYSENAIEAYVDLLVGHMQRMSDALGDTRPAALTLYFGGGTPAVLRTLDLVRLMPALERLAVLGNSSRCVEFSPDTTTPETARLWRANNFDRASLGVQTFDDSSLHAMLRRHTGSEALRSVEVLRSAGFGSVNIDLIFGRSGQSITDWMSDLRSAASSDATSCTFHPLATNEKTAFERKLNKAASDQKHLHHLHATAIDFFASAGWIRTSAISFARDGRPNPLEAAEAAGIPTLGFGAGSRTYLSDVHWSTLPSAARKSFGEVMVGYRNAVLSQTLPAASMVRLDRDEQIRRQLILQMHHGLIPSATVTRAMSQFSDRDKGHLSDLLRDDTNFCRTSEGYHLTASGAVSASEIGYRLASAAVISSLQQRSELAA